jgi:Fibronectin type III domain
MTFSGSVLRVTMALIAAVVTGLSVVTAAPAWADPGLAQPAATVPGPARIIEVSPREGQALVKWLGPEQYNPLPITGYRVETWSGGSLVGTTTVGNEYWLWVTGLTNGTAYTFTVAALNSAGWGPASAPSAPVVPHEAPGAPSSVEVTPGDGRVDVRWSAPASQGGSAITGYRVRLFVDGNWFREIHFGVALTLDVTGLSNGTAYTVDVAAENDVGYGPATSSGPITPRTVPTAPQIGATSAGAGSAIVNWAAPSSDGGAALTRYTVRVYRGSSLVKVVYPAAGATSVQATGLVNGSAHTFLVQAHNVAGAGPVSARSAAVTPVDRPSAPRIGTPSAGNASAIVRWAQPLSSGGAAVGAYVVNVYRGATLVKQVVTTSRATAATVTGLTNGVLYTATVTAKNAAGWGQPSRAVSIIPRR